MGNFEKPLTWGLVIILLGYLFVANCDCGDETSCQTNNEFNIGHEDEVKEVKKIVVKVEDENLNVDSIVDAVLEDIDEDTNIEEADSLVEIIVDLTDKEINDIEVEIEEETTEE